MSVYSGFATRGLQTTYNKMVQTLIIALKKRVIKFYKQQQCNQDKFCLVIKKLYKKLIKLQAQKYLQPKFGTLMSDLVDCLGIDINWDAASQVSGTSMLNISKLTFRKFSEEPKLRHLSRETSLNYNPKITHKSPFLFSIEKEKEKVQKKNLRSFYNNQLQQIKDLDQPRDSKTVFPKEQRKNSKFNFIEKLKQNGENSQYNSPSQYNNPGHIIEKQIGKFKDYSFQKEKKKINQQYNPKPSWMEDGFVRKHQPRFKLEGLEPLQRPKVQQFLPQMHNFTTGRTLRSLKNHEDKSDNAWQHRPKIFRKQRFSRADDLQISNI